MKIFQLKIFRSLTCVVFHSLVHFKIMSTKESLEGITLVDILHCYHIIIKITIKFSVKK